MGKWLAVASVALGVALLSWALFGRVTDEGAGVLAQLDRLEAAIHVDSETGRNPVIRSGTLRGAFGRS